MTSSLHPTEMGYLRGGEGPAVAAAVAELLARKLLAVTRHRRLTRNTLTDLVKLSPLADAVHSSLDKPQPLGDLRSAPAVREALRGIDATLTSAGLLIPRPTGLARLTSIVTGRRTVAGTQLLTALRAQHLDLKPTRRESAWEVATPQEIATSVGLFSAAALHHMDPVFGDGAGTRTSLNAEGGGNLG